MGENIIITTPQRMLTVREDYKDGLKGTILIIVHVNPHPELRANAYTNLVKHNATITDENNVKKIKYIVDVKTSDSGTGEVTITPGIEADAIKVQLLNKIIQ